jgi:hypothetical protein
MRIFPKIIWVFSLRFLKYNQGRDDRENEEEASDGTTVLNPYGNDE